MWENNTAEAWVIVASVLVLFMGAIRSKAEWLLNLVMRGILGAIAMYFVNVILEKWGISLGVGINAITILTSAILGFPGLLVLYAIGIYRTL